MILRREAEMVWTCTKEGLGYMFTWKRFWGWNCQVGEGEGGRGEDIWMLIVREDRGCRMTGGSGEV